MRWMKNTPRSCRATSTVWAASSASWDSRAWRVHVCATISDVRGEIDRRLKLPVAAPDTGCRHGNAVFTAARDVSGRISSSRPGRPPVGLAGHDGGHGPQALGVMLDLGAGEVVGHARETQLHRYGAVDREYRRGYVADALFAGVGDIEQLDLVFRELRDQLFHSLHEGRVLALVERQYRGLSQGTQRRALGGAHGGMPAAEFLG